MSMQNSIDTIGNGTRDLPACSAVPQPTAPLPNHKIVLSYININENFKNLIQAEAMRLMIILGVYTRSV